MNLWENSGSTLFGKSLISRSSWFTRPAVQDSKEEEVEAPTSLLKRETPLISGNSWCPQSPGSSCSFVLQEEEKGGVSD